MPGRSHVSLGEEQTSEPHAGILVIWRGDEFVELFEPLLEIDYITGKVDGVVDDKADPHFGNGVRVDLLAELSQHISCEGFPAAHLLDVGTVSSNDIEQLGRDCYLTFKESEERIVHFLLSPFETSDFLWQDLDVSRHFLVHLRQPL